MRLWLFVYIYIYMYVYCDDCHVILVRLHTVKSQFHPLSHNFLINVARGGINSPLEKMMLPSFAGTSDIFFRGFVGFLLLMSTTVNSGFWQRFFGMFRVYWNYEKSQGFCWKMCKYNGMQYHAIHQHHPILRINTATRWSWIYDFWFLAAFNKKDDTWLDYFCT